MRILQEIHVYISQEILSLVENNWFRTSQLSRSVGKLSATLKKIIMNRSFFVFSTLLFSVCLNAQVKISLKNTTGKRIDSLKVGDMYLGTMEKDSVKTITFEMIACDSGEPILHLSANIGKEKIVMYKKGTYQCGTFLKTVTEGKYERNLILFSIADGKNLLLARKN